MTESPELLIDGVHPLDCIDIELNFEGARLTLRNEFDSQDVERWALDWMDLENLADKASQAFLNSKGIDYFTSEASEVRPGDYLVAFHSPVDRNTVTLQMCYIVLEDKTMITLKRETVVDYTREIS